MTTSKRKQRPKIFVLDTSMILHDPNVLKNLLADGNNVVIPIWVLEELDKFKTNRDQRGINSRLFHRIIDDYREQSTGTASLKAGIPVEGGGKLSVDYNGSNWDNLPVALEHSVDNRILLVATAIQKKEKGSRIIVLSKDINMRVKADACGLETQDYQHDKKVASIGELYSGVVEIDLTGTEAGAVLQEIHRGKVEASRLGKPEIISQLMPNACCYLKMDDKYELSIFHDGHFVLANKPNKIDPTRQMPIRPKNDEQALAYALLMNPDIRLVTLVGKTGAGKTLMALLAAYQQLPKVYKRIRVWRVDSELGRPMGFLPGDIDEKFAPWKNAILDNVNIIMKGDPAEFQKDGEDEVHPNTYNLAASLADHGSLVIEPINFVLGVTRHKEIIIIDEAQNLTPREATALITRAGEGSKVILTGDPWQIYNPHLDPISNGLSVAVEAFKNQPIAGHISMKRSERSHLAELTTELMLG